MSGASNRITPFHPTITNSTTLIKNFKLPLTFFSPQYIHFCSLSHIVLVGKPQEFSLIYQTPPQTLPQKKKLELFCLLFLRSHDPASRTQLLTVAIVGQKGKLRERVLYSKNLQQQLRVETMKWIPPIHLQPNFVSWIVGSRHHSEKVGRILFKRNHQYVFKQLYNFHNMLCYKYLWLLEKSFQYII